MTRPKSINNMEALSVFYAGALHNVDTILSTDHAVENKLNSILAASFVVLIFIAGNTQVFDIQIKLGIVFLLLGIVIALVSTRIKTYYTGAVSLEDNIDYMQKSNKKFLLQIISDAETAFTKIDNKATVKALAYTFVLIFFSSGTVFCLTSIIVKRY